MASESDDDRRDQSREIVDALDQALNEDQGPPVVQVPAMEPPDMPNMHVMEASRCQASPSSP